MGIVDVSAASYAACEGQPQTETIRARDDEEGEEGEDVGVALPSRVSAPPSQRLDPANAAVSGIGNNAVTMRGRDLGGGNVTRL
jgi:hypothetical protein